VNRKPLRHVDLHTDAGRLEGLYRDIESPRAVAVVCHPLPTHGGTLHNKVVFRAARGLENAGVATLRFNFRGAGASQGQFEAGEGEQRDVEAAIEWVTARHPDVPLLVGGFSFGSWVASRVACEDDRPVAIFLLGAPVNKYDLSYLERCDKPILFLHGERDEFGSVDKLEMLISRCRNAESMIVDRADHFFAGQIELVEQAMQEWAERILEES
jgi:uncharacterized protein